MNFIEGALALVQRVDGVVNASLVDVSTGQVLGSVHTGDPGTPVVAAAAADVVRVISMMTALMGDDEDIEDVVLTLSDNYYFVRLFGTTPAGPANNPTGSTGEAGPGDSGRATGGGLEGVVLVVTLNRRRTNLALARRQLRDVEADIVP